MQPQGLKAVALVWKHFESQPESCFTIRTTHKNVHSLAWFAEEEPERLIAMNHGPTRKPTVSIIKGRSLGQAAAF